MPVFTGLMQQAEQGICKQTLCYATAKTVEDENLRLDLEAPSKKFPSMTGALKDYLERNNE